MQEHDSVRIDPDRNCFWRNSGIGVTTTGSVIDFATAFVHGEDLHAKIKRIVSDGWGRKAVRIQRKERSTGEKSGADSVKRQVARAGKKICIEFMHI